MGARGIRQVGRATRQTHAAGRRAFRHFRVCSGPRQQRTRLPTTKAITFNYLMYKSTPVVKRLPGQDVGKRYLRLSLATSEIDDTAPTSQAFPVTQIAKSSNRDGTTGKKRIEKQCRAGRG